MFSAKVKIKLTKQLNQWTGMELPLLAIIAIVLCGLFFQTVLGVPRALFYLIDAILFVSAIQILRKMYFGLWCKKSFLVALVFVLMFFLYALVGLFYFGQSPALYLWGVRNNFRFYMFFLLAAFYLKQTAIEKFCSLFVKVHYLNVVVTLIQFFVFDIKGDYLGGIFGTAQGVNGYSNIFMAIVVTIVVVQYLNKQIALMMCGQVVATCLLIAALAELKFYIVEVVLIGVVTMFCTRFSWRKVAIAVLGILGVIVAIIGLGYLYPGFADYFTLQRIWGASTRISGYTNSGDLNRLTFVTKINAMFFDTIPAQLFGMGLGSCETSGTFSFFISAFSKQYDWLHYTWLSNAFLYLELGWVGVAFFNSFFVGIAVFAFCLWQKKALSIQQKSQCQIAFVLAVLSILIGLYNSSLRTEAAYMMYLFLAIPLVVDKKT